MGKIILTVGNMVNIPSDDKVSHHNEDNNIVFIGKMNYEPNVVAVKYFAEKIFPKIRKKHQSLKFIIVGAYPDRRVLSLSSIEGIEVTGIVESVEPYYQMATIVVAPMLTGAGIQNKIIQAMSYGCCVATTQIGAEGLKIHNSEIAVLTGVKEWVSTISQLLIDRKKRMVMGKRARQYVIDNMSPEIITKQFWNFLNAAGFYS